MVIKKNIFLDKNDRLKSLETEKVFIKLWVPVNLKSNVPSLPDKFLVKGG